MPTDKAKYWYEEHADAYSTIAAMYFCLIVAKNKYNYTIYANQKAYGYKIINTFANEMKRVFNDKKSLIEKESSRKVDKIISAKTEYKNPIAEALDLMDKLLPEEWYTEVICGDKKFIYETCLSIVGCT